MKTTNRDFFMAANYIDFVSEDDYRHTDTIIHVMDANSRMLYQSMYVVDFYRQNFLYVSANPLFLCGLHPQEVKAMGYSFYMKHVPDSELRMLLEINRAVFELFHQLPVEERIKISVSYNFHIQNRDNRTLINHKLSPVLLAENGNLWLASCMVSLSSHKKAGHIEVRVAGKNEYWVYELENRKWIKFANITLNDREKEILMLASQGFSIVETAGKLFLTIDAVKYHRKSMFEKLNVQNIAEALSVAFNVKML